MSDIRARTVLAPARRTIPAYHRLLVRGQLSKGRIAAMAVLGLIAVGSAALGRQAGAGEAAATFIVANYCIGLLVPLTALLVGAPLFGNLTEDRLLVYLWLKPAPRIHLAIAAFSAAATTLIPATVIPTVAACIVSGEVDLIGPAALAATLGALSYGTIFLWFGLRFTWGLWLGLAYMVVWENLFARLDDATARISIRSYLQSIVQWGTDLEIDLADRGSVAAVVVPVGLVVVGVLLTTRTLSRSDIA